MVRLAIQSDLQVANAQSALHDVSAARLPTIRLSVPTFTIWDLSARQLHDAFWRSKGVQCVRRGEVQALSRAAELYLLVDPDQLVLFDLSGLGERLMWRDAAVTRVRLVQEQSSRYSERVVTDAEGLVQGIVRQYRPQLLCSSRIMLTPMRRVAEQWMQSQQRREGLERIRRAVRWNRVDHCRGAGLMFSEGSDEDERRLIEELIQRWPCPGQTIEGIEELEPGVWHVQGEAVEPGPVRVGPLWIGRGYAQAAAQCTIGPAFVPDALQTTGTPISTTRLRDFDDVEPAERSHPGVPTPASQTLGEISAPAGWYPVAKRGIDIVGSLAALIALSPVMLLVAICILLDDGRPLFFGHRRQGRGGKVFRCWKFRTMKRGADQMARQLSDANICDGPQVYIKNDPRVTRIGRILRKANLDELPQFWNVLVGHMSLVGPRPSPDNENQYCPAWRELRLSVRPGITGLWQLYRTRKKGSDFQEWIRYDIQYVQQAKLWLDLRLMIRTAFLLLGWRTSHATEEKD